MIHVKIKFIMGKYLRISSIFELNPSYFIPLCLLINIIMINIHRKHYKIADEVLNCKRWKKNECLLPSWHCVGDHNKPPQSPESK